MKSGLFLSFVPLASEGAIDLSTQLGSFLINTCFGRFDVFAVTVIAIGSASLWGMPKRHRVKLGSVVLASLLLLLVTTTGLLSQTLPFSPFVSSFTVVCCGAALVRFVCTQRMPEQNSDAIKDDDLEARPGIGRFWLAASLAFVVTGSYAHSVSNSAMVELEETLQANRLVRAQQRAQVVAAISPWTELLETPLMDVMVALNENIANLRKFVDENSTSAKRFPASPQLAMALMQLEENEAALKILTPLANSGAAPVALDYCGLCEQRLGNWEASLAWYEKSRVYWAQQPENQRQKQALLSAYKGIGFAHRRLDHPESATAAYQQALAIAPVAEVHFLMGRHYEEMQQTKLARLHLLKAQKLDPTGLGIQCQTLLDKMAISHFGCLQLKRDGASSSLTP